MFYLASAILCASLFAQFYKLANRCKFDGLSVNLGAYLGAVLLLSVYLHVVNRPTFDATLIGIGIFGGTATFVTVLSFYYVVRRGSLGMSWAIVGLSFVVPVVIAAVWWGDAISARKAVGLGVSMVAILCLGKERTAQEEARCVVR